MAETATPLTDAETKRTAGMFDRDPEGAWGDMVAHAKDLERALLTAQCVARTHAAHYDAERELRKQAEVSLLTAQGENERLRVDAERYRWMRSEDVNTESCYYDFWIEFSYKLTREEKMDALVDAARQSGQR